eukprot:COSAG01_NODE_9448_length_2444_cov_53.780810_1_plen_81_part_10
MTTSGVEGSPLLQQQRGRNPRTLLPPLHELPPLDEDDILPAENDNNVPVIGAFDTDADDTTEQSQFVYVQDPSTKKVSRQR